MSQDNGQPPGEAVQPPEGLRIPRAFSLVLTVTPFVGATLILLAALLVGMPEFRDSLTYDPSLLVPAAARERDAANIDHQVIRHVEELCNTVAEKSQLVDGRLPGYLDAVDYLSSSIVQARAEFAGKRVFSNVIMQLFEWTIVATGLFTTILISVKAFASPKSKGFVSMAVTAIALSSLGTSVATLNSFYRPRTTFETADRSLSMLQGLHRSLAAGLIRQRDSACKEPGDWRTDWRLRKVRSQMTEFEAIMNAASVGPASSDDEQSEKQSSPSGTQSPPEDGGTRRADNQRG